jgi:hypothetical protein
VRAADAESLRKGRGAYSHGHDNDGDDGGLFALHARRFCTDWGTDRSRHANSSGERESHGHYHAKGKNVKSDRVQSGIGRFVDRSRNLLPWPYTLSVRAMKVALRVTLAEIPLCSCVSVTFPASS